MEDLLLSIKDYQYIRKHKLNFEMRHKVKIILPEFDVYDVNNGSAKDVIFATIHGEKENIGMVKEQLRMKNEVLEINQSCVTSSSTAEKNVPVITLSDSESERPALVALSEIKNVKRKKKTKKKSTGSEADICITLSSTPEASTNCNPQHKRKLSGTISSTTDVISISNIAEVCNIPENNKRKKFKRKNSLKNRLSVNHSTTISDNTVATSSTITSENANDSIVILNTWAPIDEFIPLNSRQNNSGRKTETVTAPAADDSVIILDEHIAVVDVPRPIPKLLRPIVIDGSNVARTHGKAQKTFSCKGIQISVDYFLARGHTEITVFVPLFRKHKTIGPFPTTDPMILEDLEKRGQLVFTPSRTLNGKRMSCYDDRFIVELASSNNGVILSNDNYKDLLDEKDFKQTIEERLLMFLFVADKIMIPEDPMGRNGPCLDDFLSFPPQ